MAAYKVILKKYGQIGVNYSLFTSKKIYDAKLNEKKL
jgi:hypothetical protein